MISIVRAEETDALMLSELAVATFIESHGHSARAEDIRSYLEAKYSQSAFELELKNSSNYYFFIYHGDRPAGYSKIVFDAPFEGSNINNLAKLERLYLLKEFYRQQMGSKLFQYNVELAREQGQAGMWLNVWIENERAIKFYKSNGFTIIGQRDFKISDNHSNPNYEMFLEFSK